jgi:hypothetical protein
MLAASTGLLTTAVLATEPVSRVKAVSVLVLKRAPRACLLPPVPYSK